MKKPPVTGIVIVFAALAMLFASCSPAGTAPATKEPSAAVELVFTNQPAGAAAGSPLASQPAVAAVDAGGNIVRDHKLLVELTITPGTGHPRAAIFGGTTVVGEDGAAAFKDLSINRSGTGYTLTATSRGLTPATSDAFDIAPGTAVGLVFSSQPAGATAGSAFTTSVAVIDNFGNIVTGYNAPVTLSLIPGSTGGIYSGDHGVILSGATTVNAESGVATFTDISIDVADSGYRLVATSGSLVSATSHLFTIKPGAAVKLEFILHPAGAVAGSAFATQPVIWVEDDSGNVCQPPAEMPQITLSITPGTGTGGAALSGTTALSGHVIWFSGLAIDLAGTGYTLTATGEGLTPAVSHPFDVAAPAE